MVEDEGLCRVGWSEASSSLNLGTDGGGYGFGGTGKKSNKGSFDNYGEAFGLNDVIGTVLDWTTRTISFSKNGKDLGVAFTLGGHVKGPLFPAVVLKNAQMGFNFGLKPFKQTLPTGSRPLCQAKTEECAENVAVHELSTKEVPKDVPCPLALILEPARELADQAYQCLDIFKVRCIYTRTLLYIC